MRKLFLIIPSFLLVLWIIGFGIYKAGPLIHILLILSMISVLIYIINPKNNE